METAPTPLPYDALISAVQAAFDARHPPASLPDWFATSVGQSQRFTDDKLLKVEWYAHPALKLKPNEKWVERNGHEVLQTVDEVTGDVRYALNYYSGEPIILFQAIVYPLSGAVEVLKDMDISGLRREEIDHPRAARPGSQTARVK